MKVSLFFWYISLIPVFIWILTSSKTPARFTRSRIWSTSFTIRMLKAFRHLSSMSLGLWRYRLVNTVCAREWPSNQVTYQHKCYKTDDDASTYQHKCYKTDNKLILCRNNLQTSRISCPYNWYLERYFIDTINVYMLYQVIFMPL